MKKSREKSKKLIVVSLLLVIAIAVVGYSWFFHGTRPLFKNTSLPLYRAQWFVTSSSQEDIDLMANPDFNADALIDILNDAVISRTKIKKAAGHGSVDPAFFNFLYWESSSDTEYRIWVGENYSRVSFTDSRYIWELENHDEIYTRLMDLFGDKIPA